MHTFTLLPIILQFTNTHTHTISHRSMHINTPSWISSSREPNIWFCREILWEVLVITPGKGMELIVQDIISLRVARKGEGRWGKAEGASGQYKKRGPNEMGCWKGGEMFSDRTISAKYLIKESFPHFLSRPPVFWF